MGKKQKSDPNQDKNSYDSLKSSSNTVIFSIAAIAFGVAVAAYIDPSTLTRGFSQSISLINIACQTASQLTGYNSIGQAAGAVVYFQRVFSYANLCKDVGQNILNKIFGKEENPAPTSVSDKIIKDTRSIAPLIAGGLALNLVTGEGLQNSLIKTVAAGIFGNSFPQIGKFLQSSLVNKIVINTAMWSSVASSLSLPRFALAPLMTLSSISSLAFETYNNKYDRAIENQPLLAPRLKFMSGAMLQAETVAGIQLARDGRIDPFFGLTSVLNMTSLLLKPTKLPTQDPIKEIGKPLSQLASSSSNVIRRDGKTWVEAIGLTAQKGMGIA